MGSSSTPSAPKHVYLTPQIEKVAKRRDGLCPSLLLDGHVSSINAKGGNGTFAQVKSYQTNTKFLNDEIRDLENSGEELKFITDSINHFLRDAVDERKQSTDLIGMKFQPKGCIWHLEMNPSIGAPDYMITIQVLANEGSHNTTTFVVDTMLVGKSSKHVASTSLPGFREAKATFEMCALVVRKAIVKCEFPTFPEGCKGRAFREVYQLNARLKSGSFATVCRGTHRASGKKVAIKCVLRKDLPPTDDAAIFDEVAIMSSLSHPHIVPLIDFFEEKDCYFLVMELMSGGDLFDRIGKKKSYSEADARDLAIKMLKAMSYCHAHRIAHCDMKPKNLLLMSEDNDSYIKLADFGFAARCHTAKSLSKQCGTPFFVSPEILMRQPYDWQSDMWSVGCIIFLLLSGNLPFMGRSQKELFRKIVSGKFEFDEDDWCDVSPDAKDLVKKLLVLDPDERLTSNEALKHKWMKASNDRLKKMTLEGTSQRLKTFNARMKLRSAMIAVEWVSSLKKTSWLSQRNMNAK
eukprot:Nitzschia sp. Nitz4//scaffold113_size70149//35399//37051//NITZ4_005950-RA/size70149-augustus-gene-0.84-mRNA-1//1//CDS//3329533341//6090//frame0